MSKWYVLRLFVWAVLVVALAWMLIHWTTSGFPRPMVRPPMPVSSDPSFLDGWVNRPLDFLRDNWLFATELLLLLGCATGRVGKIVGVQDLVFPESPKLRFLTGLAYGFAFGNLLFTAYVTSLPNQLWAASDRVTLYSIVASGPLNDEAIPIRRAGGFLLVAWPLALLVLYIPASLGRQTACRTMRQPWFGLGLLASVAITVAAVFAGWQIVSNEMISGNWRDFYAQMPGAQDGRIAPHEFPLHLLATLGTLVPLFLLVAFAAATLSGHIGSPVWVVCLLVWCFNGVYGFVGYHFGGLQYVLVLFVVLFWMTCNTRHEYKLSFPNLGPETVAARSGLSASICTMCPEPGRTIATELVLANACERWQRQHGTKSKPKMIVVATSGGGIRAATWTGAVLEGLDRHIAGFGDHIRLMTGASGGMVAAALFAGHRLHPTIGPSLAHRLAEDSLWPVMESLILADLPSSLLPFHRDWDRARSLEAAWHRNAPPIAPQGKSPFRTTFGELRAAELDGRAPILLFCPVLVEDGRRLFVSNLDLASIAAESVPTAILRPDGSNGCERSLVSRPAIEFFRLFPNSIDRFEIGTAARMSATFPFVSPGVSLPTSPPRRVVDAGYFDNYGINVAAQWLYRHRRSVEELTSGVAILEIRAFPMEEQKRSVELRPKDALGSAFSGLSTPAEALASVQSAGSFFRNDQQLGILDEEFNRRSARDDFFVRVPFECPYDAAMSWALTAWDRDRIIDCFADAAHAERAGVAGAIAGLKAWFGSGGA